MCGITGIYFRDGRPVQKDELRRFTDTLIHRGPDGGDVYVDPAQAHVGLGHRRLAILDLSDAGRQPMRSRPSRAESEDGRYVLTYNGEVYNFLELRRELQSAGYQFHTQTDTEVVLYAYAHWGPACQERFNGMWAFAIYDRREDRLFLSRDRFGIKPLYYYARDAVFSFASETSSFRELSDYRREVDRRNLSRVLADPFGIEGYGETIFAGVRQVRPGYCLRLDRDGLREERWWTTQGHGDTPPEEYAQQSEHLRELLHDAVKLRLRSDVGIGTALSGGLDSSSLFSMLRHVERSGEDVERAPADWHKAYVSVFPGTDLDEEQYAREVVDYWNGDAAYIEPDFSNLTDWLVNTTRAQDYVYITPPVAERVYNRMRTEGVVVSMDGHGVDEMLLGYGGLLEIAWHWALKTGRVGYAAELEDIIVTSVQGDDNAAVRRRMNQARGRLQPGLLRRSYERLPEPLKAAYRKLRGVKPGETPPHPFLFDVPEHARHDLDEVDDMNEIDRLIYESFHVTILPTILRNFDRASMHNGVEIRMPYMDWRFVSYVFQLPIECKAGAGYTKRILRDAMRGLMPESIRLRKQKIGLNAPMRHWFVKELRELILDVVHSRDFLESDIWNGPALRDFAEQRIENDSWTWGDCVMFWPYVNAHLIVNHRPVAAT